VGAHAARIHLSRGQSLLAIQQNRRRKLNRTGFRSGAGQGFDEVLTL